MTLRSLQYSPARALRFPEALTCAIVLEPERFSRNKHFAFYVAPRARAAHSRAVFLRTLARQIQTLPCEPSISYRDPDFVLLIEDPSISLRRTVRLGAIELSLLRFMLARAGYCGPHSLQLLPADVDSLKWTLQQIGVDMPATVDRDVA